MESTAKHLILEENSKYDLTKIVLTIQSQIKAYVYKLSKKRKNRKFCFFQRIMQILNFS